MPYKSESVMDQIASCNFTTDWGTRIVSEKAKFFAPGGYHTGSVWPLFTGWASLGDFAAGKPDQGYSKLMSNLLIYKNWSLGYIEEVLHGTQYKYFGVCRHQCWSETMVIQPSIDGMLGFTPDAMNHRTGITLDFPMDWNESQADNLRVGDHLFSVKQSRTPQKTTITLMQTAGSGENAPALKIDLKARVLKGARVDQVLLNGTAVPFVKPATNEPYVGISLALNQVQNIEIVHSGGIGVLPVVHHPLPGDSSKGIKILSDELIGNKYVVKVEGLSGTTGEIRINRAGNITFEKFTLPAGKEKYSRKDLVFYESQPEAEIIYYVLPRSFYDTNGDLTGDLKGLTQKLDYLQELGVTSLLMLPLYESEFYHNYFATDYRKIDPEYGSMEDLVTLFREAHKRDMKVYLDMETQYVTEGSEWYTSKSDYQIKGTPWGNLRGYDGIQRGMNMANVNNPDVRRYFFNLYAYFLDPNGDGNFEDGADGFRIDHIMDDLDNTGKLTNLYADYWKPLFNHLKTINPDIRIVGEQANWFSFGDEIFSKADIDGVFAFPLCISIAQMTKDLIQRMADTTDLLTPGNKEQLIFIENHDLDRFASRVGGSLPKEKVGAAFNLLLKGVPLIYYGQELGMKGIKYEGKDDGNDIPRREAFEWYKSTEGPGMSHWYKDSGPWWDNRNSQSGDGISLEEQKAAPGSLWNFYRSLISLRKSEPALTGGEQRFVANDNPGVITFLRYLGGDVLLVAVNLTDKPQTVNLLEKIQLTGKVIFTEPAGAGIRQNRLTLKPYGVSVIR
jgi:glycosidase